MTERKLLFSMPRDKHNRDCNWLFDKYIRDSLAPHDELMHTRHDDDKECHYIIKRAYPSPRLNINTNIQKSSS